MKAVISIFLIFFSTYFFAQQGIFNNQIVANNLSVNEKLTEEHSKDYIITKYYHQSQFNLSQELEINLPTGRKIVAFFDKKYTYTNTAESFVYKIENEPFSELVLSKYDSVITGIYGSETGEKIMIFQTAPEIFALSVFDQSKLDAQDSALDTLEASLENSNQLKMANENVCAASTTCPPTVIDVMIIYTTAVKNQWSGLAQSNAQCATIVTNFNNSLVNSGVVNVSLNLSYSGEIIYTESGNISTDLSRLRNQTDGFMDDAHTLRDTYAADLCALITSTPTDTCGLGYVQSNPSNYNDTYAFTVSLRGCSVGNYTVAHEMGHNMGLHHDWYVSSSTTPCSHHHGYINQNAILQGTSSPSNTRWRTIMAYTDQCTDAGIGCPKINRWSNPNLNYNGDPTGVNLLDPQPSYEVYGFQRFACAVSDFRSPNLNVNEISKKIKEIEIYPNPVKETLFVKSPKNSKLKFDIINTVGQKILSTSSSEISVKTMAKGEYFLMIYGDDKSFLGTKKFIVE